MYKFEVKVIIPKQDEINTIEESNLSMYWAAYFAVQARVKARHILSRGVNVLVKRHNTEQ